MDLDDLSKDIEKLVLGFPKQASQIVRLVALQSINNLVLTTPRDTGRAAANWFATVDIPSSEETENTDWRSNLNEQRSKLSQPFSFHSIWITNNLPYILRLNDGWSQQQPEGFVEKAVVAAERQISKAKIEA